MLWMLPAFTPTRKLHFLQKMRVNAESWNDFEVVVLVVVVAEVVEVVVKTAEAKVVVIEIVAKVVGVAAVLIIVVVVAEVIVEILVVAEVAVVVVWIYQQLKGTQLPKIAQHQFVTVSGQAEGAQSLRQTCRL